MARGIGLDNRIGGKFLNAGPGYGGSCFPKDTLALVQTARDAGSPVELIETTVRVNDARKKAMAAKVGEAIDGELAGKTIGVLGLTFKPNTDDMRDAPVAGHRAGPAGRGREVQAFDPEGMHEARQLLRGVDFKDDPYDVAAGADVLVIITEWDQFRALDLDRIKLLMNKPVHGRPAQHLQARRHARPRLRLHQRGPPGGLRVGKPRLFHVSEEAGIVRFEPRPAPSPDAGVEGDAVWAVAQSHLVNFLTPRDCPRITFRAGPDTSEADRARFLAGAERVVAFEASLAGARAGLHLPGLRNAAGDLRGGAAGSGLLDFTGGGDAARRRGAVDLLQTPLPKAGAEVGSSRISGRYVTRSRPRAPAILHPAEAEREAQAVRSLSSPAAGIAPIQRAPAQKATAAARRRPDRRRNWRPSQRPRCTSECEVASHVFSQVSFFESEPVERCGHYEIVTMIEAWVGFPPVG